MTTFRCPECSTLTSYDTVALRMARSSGGLRCAECATRLTDKDAINKKRRSDNLRRSKKQEQSAAKRHGARRQKGSGAMDHAKGDFRDPGKVRGECKFTRAKSFSLKLADLMKLEEQATLGERPVFEIEFQGQQPVMRYVVLPGWLYDYYQSLAGD